MEFTRFGIILSLSEVTTLEMFDTIDNLCLPFENNLEVPSARSDSSSFCNITSEVSNPNKQATDIACDSSLQISTSRKNIEPHVTEISSETRNVISTTPLEIPDIKDGTNCTSCRQSYSSVLSSVTSKKKKRRKKKTCKKQGPVVIVTKMNRNFRRKWKVIQDDNFSFLHLFFTKSFATRLRKTLPSNILRTRKGLTRMITEWRKIRQTRPLLFQILSSEIRKLDTGDRRWKKFHCRMHKAKRNTPIQTRLQLVKMHATEKLPLYAKLFSEDGPSCLELAGYNGKVLKIMSEDEGVIVCVFQGRVLDVLFKPSEVHVKNSSKHMTNTLDVGMFVHFDASFCRQTKDSQNVICMANAVWLGKKPNLFVAGKQSCSFLPFCTNR